MDKRKQLPSDEQMKQLDACGLARRGRKPLPEGFWDEPMPCVPVEVVRAAMREERDRH